jgi:hypothetical protein
MTTFCIQIQPHRAPDLDLAKIKEFGEAIASDKELVLRFEIVEGVDGVSYTNLMFETAEAPSLWRKLHSELYSGEEICDDMLRASIAMCEGKDGWNDYLLLYHFNEGEKLDKFQ